MKKTSLNTLLPISGIIFDSNSHQVTRVKHSNFNVLLHNKVFVVKLQSSQYSFLGNYLIGYFLSNGVSVHTFIKYDLMRNVTKC